MSDTEKAATSYWTEAQMQSVHHMMNPRSIAVVGATERMQYGGRMLALALRAAMLSRAMRASLISSKSCSVSVRTLVRPVL